MKLKYLKTAGVIVVGMLFLMGDACADDKDNGCAPPHDDNIRLRNNEESNN